MIVFRDLANCRVKGAHVLVCCVESDEERRGWLWRRAGCVDGWEQKSDADRADGTGSSIVQDSVQEQLPELAVRFRASD